ncbi:MAG: AbrB/MazE/SpoVT family DNA-binding domain-containing protein [Gemmatimonadetes bacterium]|nr:AbrB/MazE/SpoVT family DNA-binding domain-containing protein [Gemmatimonadota bacterium]
METVTISPEFHVSIPRSIRERLNLKVGQRLQLFTFENRIVLVPLRPARALRGSLRGMSTALEREEDRF